MKKYLFISTSLICLQCAYLSAQSPQADSESKFYMGVCTHFAQYKGECNLNLNLIKQGGFNATRDDIYWGNSEKEKGRYEFPPAYLDAPRKAKEYGLEQLSVLAYSNSLYNDGAYPETPEAIDAYAEFCSRTVAQTKDCAKLFQVWNEWDGGCGMPRFKGTSTPQGYAKLLAAAYKKIKAANPQAIVVGNSICTGDEAFEETLKCGIIANCDYLSLHTYNHSQGEKSRTATAWYKRMIKIGDMIKKYNGGKEKKLLITEMGFNNRIGRIGYSYKQSADFAAQMYLLARTLPWLKGIFWYDFQDDGLNEFELEDNFGIVRYDLTQKPVYYALAGISDIVKNADFIERIDAKDDDIYILKFKLGAKDVLAMWSTDEKTRTAAVFSTNSPSDISLRSAGSPVIIRKWGWRNSGGKIEPNKIGFTLTQTPLIAESNFANTKLFECKKIDFDETKRPQTYSLNIPTQVDIINANGTEIELKDQKSAKTFGKCAAKYSRDTLELELHINGSPKSDTITLGFAVDAEHSGQPFTKLIVNACEQVGECRTEFSQFNNKVKPIKFEISQTDVGYICKIKISAADLRTTAFEKQLMLKYTICVKRQNENGSKTIFNYGEGAIKWPLSSDEFKTLYFN